MRVRWFRKVFDRIGDADEELYGQAWSAAAVLPGDFNNDGTVDAADYVVWRKSGATQAGCDTWRTIFGASRGVGSFRVLASAGPPLEAVPEPVLIALVLIATGCWVALPRRRVPARIEACQ